MKTKIYAIKKGFNTGIFFTWKECQKNIHGFSGAEYKSFTKIEDAESYLNMDENTVNIEKDNKNFLEIYTDGACSPNPGQGGCGIVILKDDKIFKKYCGLYNESSTNQRAELLALIYAFKIIKQNLTNEKVKIFTDSKYSIDCISWSKGWIKNNWKTSKKEDVKNKDLLEVYIHLYNEINTPDLIHVNGHSNIYGNELADKMAVKARKEKIKNLILVND